MEPIAHVFHADRLRDLVDGKTYARGEAYFKEGRVSQMARQGATVSARVTGATPYDVKLWVTSGRIAYACSCPVGNEGNFCKHCVAVSLAILAANPPPPLDAPRPDAPRPDAAPPDAAMSGRVMIVDHAFDAQLDDVAVVRGWDLETAGEVDLVAIRVAQDGAALLALGLLATSGKAIVCCHDDHPHAAMVAAVCRHHGIHLTRSEPELRAAVRARLRSFSAG